MASSRSSPDTGPVRPVVGYSAPRQTPEAIPKRTLERARVGNAPPGQFLEPYRNVEHFLRGLEAEFASRLLRRPAGPHPSRSGRPDRTRFSRFFHRACNIRAGMWSLSGGEVSSRRMMRRPDPASEHQDTRTGAEAIPAVGDMTDRC